MLTVENFEVLGLEHSIRGMRNPMNSWDKSDSAWVYENPDEEWTFRVGDNDLSLMRKLAAGGSCHAKYRRMIAVYADINAPLYWWKEFDTYKVGTVANSCSTMHKIHSRDLRLEDFSYEHLDEDSMHFLLSLLELVNRKRRDFVESKNKTSWYNMIQLLPESYNQKRTVMMNYEVLSSIYPMRRNHKLDEWHTFCDWVETLPYADGVIYRKGTVE